MVTTTLPGWGCMQWWPWLPRTEGACSGDHDTPGRRVHAVVTMTPPGGGCLQWWPWHRRAGGACSSDHDTLGGGCMQWWPWHPRAEGAQCNTFLLIYNAVHIYVMWPSIIFWRSLCILMEVINSSTGCRIISQTTMLHSMDNYIVPIQYIKASTVFVLRYSIGRCCCIYGIHIKTLHMLRNRACHFFTALFIMWMQDVLNVCSIGRITSCVILYFATYYMFGYIYIMYC